MFMEASAACRENSTRNLLHLEHSTFGMSKLLVPHISDSRIQSKNLTLLSQQRRGGSLLLGVNNTASNRRGG